MNRSNLRIHDVTIPLRDTLAGWPGDTPFAFRLAWSRATGATVNVGQITTSLHAGTHVDAPFHFLDAGPTVADLPLEPFLGPARLIDVRDRPILRRADLQAHDLAGTPRLLLKTGGWPDHSRFPESIPVIDADVPVFLNEQGVILLGLDLPSVDPLDSKTLANHHALGAAGIAILEGLDLASVPPGVYELIALPLRIVGADGAPVRAVLREMAVSTQ